MIEQNQMEHRNITLLAILLIAVPVIMFGLILGLNKLTLKDGNNMSYKSTTEDSNDVAGAQDIAQLDIETVEEGSGDRVAQEGDTVSVHYVGILLDGTQFDSSVDRGVPFEFTLGQGRVIEGWEKGILGMKVGEKRVLRIPPSMGYGEYGSPPVIPPNAALQFEVTLIEFK